MQTRKWLEEGFCPVDRYNCLMPVEYEAEEKKNVYFSRKHQMFLVQMLCGMIVSNY